jgi:iron complex outermembrane receptor protein
MMKPLPHTPAACALLWLAGAPAALAQAPAELSAITVTADKQERALESVPASLSVFDGDMLEAHGIQDLEALQTITPGLSFQPFGQAGVNSPVMRGLSANFFSFSTSTLLVVDGVPTLTAQGYDDQLLAIDRVEVLRGPQSTLYGRNAEAGVINIHTRQPDNTVRGQFSAEAGSRDLRALRFDLSGPLVEDRLYASVAGTWRSQHGFIDNT